MKLLYIVLLSLVVFSCKNQGEMNTEGVTQATVDSMKIVAEKQRVIDSMQTEMDRVRAEKEVIVVNQPGTSTSTTTTTTVTEKKKMSGAVKGALIGAGVGAVTGAAISEKKGEGAIIGGLAGAGVGAGTGAIIEGSKK